MRKTPAALLASSALLIPTAVLAAAPAEAVELSITNCSKTKYGVEVRIKIRDEGNTGRVRLSHPDGRGNFREPAVRKIWSGVRHVGPAGSGVGGGASITAHYNDPSYRTRTPNEGTVTVLATFVLRNGNKIEMSCRMR